MKKGISFIILLLALAGSYGIYNYFTIRQEKVVAEQSQVLLEKIRSVCQLVTVEGHFSEIYDYKDYWSYDWSPFRKKALIRIKAKVSVGYDLNYLKIESDTDTKTVRISQLPAPSILSIDHDVDYYDITQGSFNYFTAEDYTLLNQKAKNFVRQQAEKSDLFTAAEAQGNQLLEMIQFMVQSMGWELEYFSASPITQDTLLKE